MISSRRPARVIILFACLLLSGCSATRHSMKSFPSLSEENEFTGGELSPLEELPPTRMSISGVHIDIRIRNHMTLRVYDTSFMVPIERFNIESDQSGVGKDEIGKKPFKIDLYLTADGEGATFTPSRTRLYFDKDDEPIYPIGIYGSVKGVQCGKRPIRAHIYTTNIDNTPITSEPISIVNKNIIEESERAYLANQTCLRLAFDVVTPDPSEKFRLELGGIVTSSQQTMRPVIYFNPITYRVWTH